ncbi:MAG: protein kinase, partial [Bacteroidaceae bacterium]|nr:protein kinase [Bacteroidaceae bacterium]
MKLSKNTSLQGGRYSIIESIGKGGFGITYLATQRGLDRTVVIKEFFMSDYCARERDTLRVTFGTDSSRGMIERFREKFVKEARNIAAFDHPNIVRVIDVFEENNTAYYVMEYHSAGSLGSLV